MDHANGCLCGHLDIAAPSLRAFGGHWLLYQAQRLEIGPILLLMWTRRHSPRGFLMTYLVHLGVFSIILLM